MIALFADYHGWFLAAHIIAVMFWMAGLYYLPRLFVYHIEARDKGAAGTQITTFLKMQHNLLRIIMLPALLAAWGFGAVLLVHYVVVLDWHGWLIIKLGAVLFLSAYHGFLARVHRQLATGRAVGSARFFRVINEIPPLLTILIVILAVLKPF